MKSNLKTANVRGSIFVPKVAYNSENLDKMRSVFVGYMPTIIAPSLVAPVFPPFVGALNTNMWRLISPDQLVNISFFDEKIDIVVNTNNLSYDVSEIGKLGTFFFESFKKIVNLFGFTSTRLALAPTLYLPFSEGDSFVKDFTCRIFSFNQFKGSYLDNCDFSQVFRVMNKLNGKDYLINNLVKFSTELFQEQKGNNILVEQRMNISVDINTFVNPQYIFSVLEIFEFFKMSPQWCEELMCSYFK